ncbi:hypothetical protein [Prauserella endophytica]|uniref:Minor tail protein n=1 Tax=Prauserella endophytica TaxID=1592324 RepID=A0ABY2RS89_9PSEU|nr:hypothetical protein [Prauserella endophytica]TKG58108.1 hypothetical protein FCN18_38450 [Prauserella endophytica]
MPNTDLYGLPYPALTDPPNGPEQMQALADAIEAALSTVDGALRDELAEVAGGAGGSHVWSGSRTVGDTAGNYLNITNLSAVRSAGIATLTGGTTITLNRAGKWALTVVCGVNAPSAGVEKCQIAWPGGPFVGGSLASAVPSGGGFGGAGVVSFGPVWTGWVTATQAAAGLTVQVGRDSAGGDQAAHPTVVYAEYLGAGYTP